MTQEPLSPPSILKIIATHGPKALDPLTLARYLDVPIPTVVNHIGADAQAVVAFIQDHWQSLFLTTFAPMATEFSNTAIHPMEALAELILLRLEVCSRIDPPPLGDTQEGGTDTVKTPPASDRKLPWILASYQWQNLGYSLPKVVLPLGKGGDICSSVNTFQKAITTMVTLCGLQDEGPYGTVRRHCLAGIYLWSLKLWADDTSPGSQRTMASLMERLHMAALPFPQIWHRGA